MEGRQLPQQGRKVTTVQQILVLGILCPEVLLLPATKPVPPHFFLESSSAILISQKAQGLAQVTVDQAKLC